MSVVKEKNLLFITVEGKNKPYTFNINTGELLGLRGLQLETFPPKAPLKRALREHGTALARCLYKMIDCETRPSRLRQGDMLTLLKNFDRLDALGKVNPNLEFYHIEKLVKEFDNLVAFLKKTDIKVEQITNTTIREFENAITEIEMERRLGANPTLTFEQYDRFKQYRVTNDWDKEEWNVAGYYLNNGKLEEYYGIQSYNNISLKLDTYFKYCKDLNKKYEKQTNFIREFVETKRTYNLMKEEIDGAKMQRNYAKHEKAFDFAFGNYVVVVPKTPKDIIKEGVDMHHCVGGYVDSVVNNDKYIVFVRHKDTPDKCYLTCEVLTDGQIRQYFLAYDRHISSEADIVFKKKFQEHLDAYWNA